MFETCLKKQEEVKKLFSSAASIEDRYQLIIDLGRKQTPLLPEDKTEQARVIGCQSNMFLKAYLLNNRCQFQTESDALISAGLGALLTLVYNDEPPETVLKCPPTYLDELNIRASLTPGRANGLASLYLHMKQEALKMYMALNRTI